MYLVVLSLSLIYLFIRYQFRTKISYKNGNRDIYLLIVGNVLLILSFCMVSYLPDLANVNLPLALISIYIISIPSMWHSNSNFLLRIVSLILAALTVIPFVNMVTLLLLALLLLIQGYRNNTLYSAIGLAVTSIGTVIAIILQSPQIQWSCMILFFVIQHILHTNQLLEMMKNASKNVVTDVLTGLYNRRWLYKKLEKMESNNVGIIFCDIDNFKKLNDEQGHEQGDLVLERIGEIIRRVLNGRGAAARYGGEELVGVVYDYNRTKELAEKILETTRNELNVTMSIGVAIGHENHEELIKIADERMYISKTTGKNKVTYETPEKET